MLPAYDYVLMLPPDAIRKVAHDARTLASKLDDAAAVKERRLRNAAAVRKNRRRRRDIIGIMAEYIKSGMSPGQAAHATATQAALEPERLEPLLAQAARLADRKHLDTRNRRIAQLARSGLKDKEIAAQCTNPKTGKPLHPKSVNRILSGLRRQAGWEKTKPTAA